MAKALRAAAMIAGAIALIATGVGAFAVAGSTLATTAATVATWATVTAPVTSFGFALKDSTHDSSERRDSRRYGIPVERHGMVRARHGPDDRDRSKDVPRPALAVGRIDDADRG